MFKINDDHDDDDVVDNDNGCRNMGILLDHIETEGSDELQKMP